MIKSINDIKGKYFYRSWGYEQTNVNFYKVIEVKGKATAVLQEVGTKVVKNDSGRNDYVIPDDNIKIGKPFKKRINLKHGTFKHDWDWGYLWDGQPKYQTNPYYCY